MTNVLKSGLASAAVALTAAFATPASAADLGGSLKDGYIAPMPQVHAASAGPCYFRADVGGSVSRDPSVDWPVYNEVFVDDTSPADDPTVIDQHEIDYVFAGSEVSQVSMENTWLVDVGVGCGSGSRGLRAEAVFSFRGDRKIDGIPFVYNGSLIGEPEGTPPDDFDDPLHTSVKSYSLMFNAYYDFGRIGNFVPYLGAGVGAAYNIMDEVYFTENPALINRIEGNRDLSFAWSLMAGVGYQISDRAILDFGYRYIDLGKIESGRVDSAGFVNPAVKVDDLGAHEFKLGLRYHFGSSGNCCEYAALK